ncbi:unnamed protein product [Prorocentrum cordatum]|uniref:Uncharacterized protein n=1 Tax=Prorocentrum cordatum TaxID=2364126 RepID=A0ABN9Q6P4_9DINO|nr:unnamed protein product [Polarella glacialis]
MGMAGSAWRVCCTHLVYAEGALVVVVLRVLDGGLPMEPGTIPHATLLTRPPFVPGHSREALEAARASGLLDCSSAGLRVLRQAAVGHGLVDLYVERLGVAESVAAPAAGSAGTPLECRLEGFWG